MAFFNYIKDVLEELAKLLVVGISTAVINLGLIYGSWYMWEVFTNTYSGKTFQSMHPERTHLIEEFFAFEPYWQTAAEIAGAALVFTFAVALVAQLIYLRHLLYSTLWGPLKLVWAVGLCFAIAWLLQRYDGNLSSFYSYIIVMMPSMACVLFSSMKAAQRILPDFGTLVLLIIHRF